MLQLLSHICVISLIYKYTYEFLEVALLSQGVSLLFKFW